MLVVVIVHGDGVGVLEGITAIVGSRLVAEVVVRRRVGGVLVVVKGRALRVMRRVSAVVLRVVVVVGSHVNERMGENKAVDLFKRRNKEGSYRPFSKRLS